MNMPILRLKKHEARRLRQGHIWIFSNEVDVAQTPLKQFAPGEQVLVQDYDGKVIGIAYVNPNSLICGRLISTDSRCCLDQNLLIERISRALRLRDRIFAKPFYRLVYGESDGLPGLVIDRYDDVLVAQITTAGMERVKAEIAAALTAILKPRAVLLRNDSSMRALEGLPQVIEPLIGEPPAEIMLEENGVRFATSILTGQKTGWFYDHRLNRARLQPYVKGKRVLDVFSYIGGWGIQAAVSGAQHVTCIDSSKAALAQMQHNAELNKVAASVTTMAGDAFEQLSALRQAQEYFDVVIVDPPAFIKRRKDLKEGTNAYRRINELAMRLIQPEGILVAASCSLHLPRETLVAIVHQAAQRLGRGAQLLEQGHQGPDHPVHPAIAETDYIKSLTVRL